MSRQEFERILEISLAQLEAGVGLEVILKENLNWDLNEKASRSNAAAEGQWYENEFNAYIGFAIYIIYGNDIFCY